MNDTTVIGSAGQVEDVRAYVRAVRAWLGDLPADEVEDLTAGMEADLAERAAESGGPLGGLLGQPEAYAAELRSAAGLPARVDVVVPDAVRQVPWSDRVVRDAHELVARHPWLRELRPTWWLARGAVLGWVLASILGTGRTVLLPLAGAVLSMWLGLTLRRREPLATPARVALASANVLAALLLLPMVASHTSGSSAFSDEVAMAAGYPSQVVANGEPAQNLYAYDAAGNRLEGVRIYDQSGQALFVGLDPLMDGRTPDLPVRPDDGLPNVAPDVFPLTWPGHDAWQDPGFGWTPPLSLPPLAGTTGSRRRRRVPAPRRVPARPRARRPVPHRARAARRSRCVRCSGEERRGRGHGIQWPRPRGPTGRGRRLKIATGTGSTPVGGTSAPGQGVPSWRVGTSSAPRTSTLVTRAVTTPP